MGLKTQKSSNIVQKNASVCNRNTPLAMNKLILRKYEKYAYWMPEAMKCVFICLRHITVCVRYTILKWSNRSINTQREQRHLIVQPMFSVPSGNESVDAFERYKCIWHAFRRESIVKRPFHTVQPTCVFVCTAIVVGVLHFFLRLQWILWIPLIVHKQLPARNMLCGRILVSLLRKLANCYPQYIFIHLKNKTQIKEFYVALGYKWERGLHYMHRHQEKKTRASLLLETSNFRASWKSWMNFVRILFVSLLIIS